MPEAASSFIQEILSASKECVNVGRPNYTTKEYKRVFDAFVYERDESVARKEIEKYLKSFDSECLVLSDEKLSNFNSNYVGRRLADVVSQSTVILVARDPKTAIASIYNAHDYQLKYLPGPYIGKPVRCENFFDYYVVKRTDGRYNAFCSQEYIKGYRQLAKEMYLFTFELFAKNIAQFLELLGDVIEARLTPISDSFNVSKRYLRPGDKLLSLFPCLKKATLQLTPDQEQLLFDLYDEYVPGYRIVKGEKG